ncbi:MAG TPA: FeoA family protein [Bacteriovoracaceae bacterium]|nr:FeoA family protein [Bacteriovoracaceae bacterium]
MNLFDISNFMTINHAPLHQNLKVCSFGVGEIRDFNEIESRLMLLGFLEGAIVRVTKKAIFFKEPLLVEVRGRLVAMTKSEAELVRVEVIK